MNHLGGSGEGGDPKTMIPDVWGYVCLKYGLKSILDVGCAHGFNARWLLDHGYDVEGVEGFPEYVKNSRLPANRIHLHDFTTGPFIPDRFFDLALCTEFVEHVRQEFVGNFVATFSLCKFVLMSHALPGQGGHHHVNEKDSIYWIKVMDMAGFEILVEDTQIIRSTYQPKDLYGRNTLMLFQTKIPGAFPPR